MWPNPQFPADLVTFTRETLNGKPYFLCSATDFAKQMYGSSFKMHLRYNNGDLKILLHIPIHIQKISEKISILNPTNSWVIYP